MNRNEPANLIHAQLDFEVTQLGIVAFTRRFYMGKQEGSNTCRRLFELHMDAMTLSRARAQCITADWKKGSVMTYEQQIKQWLTAARKASKRVLSSKRKTREFMKRTGIVAKNGKRLAKAYR